MGWGNGRQRCSIDLGFMHRMGQACRCPTGKHALALPFSKFGALLTLDTALAFRAPIERIWPFGDLFGVFPHHVVLTEEEEGAVDRQAALPDRNGVVDCHGAGSLGHRLFVYPLGPRGPTLPDAPGAPATSSSACGSRASSACCTTSCPIAGRHLVSKPSHPAKSKGPGIMLLRRMLPERSSSSSHPIGCCGGGGGG